MRKFCNYMTMEPIAVSIQNVSKKFRLFNSPEDRLKEALHPFKKKYHKEFWALKDISFDVPKGETIGIIGRNGSGKSTLLQIICGVLQPTTGSVNVNGRISALLELGADFNPEFTGRENVLMKGIRTGLSKAEIKKRLPEIEDFADIGEFIDYPLKTYSSGMFVRLAFATAINIDPEILIVDEALAVGDAKFQHKCFQKFIEFQENGKTIILVTHDTNAVIKHCNIAFLLENGRVLECGNPNHTVNKYIDILEGRHKQEDIPDSECVFNSSNKIEKCNTNTCSKTQLDKFLDEIPEADNCPRRNSYNKNEYRQGYTKAEIIDYLVVCGDKYDPTTILSGDMIDIYLKAKFHDPVETPVFGFAIKTIDGLLIYGFNTVYNKTVIPSASKSEIIVFKFSVKMNLITGDFFADLGVAEHVENENIRVFDRRCSLCCLKVRHKNEFDGLVDFEPAMEVASRKITSY